MEIKLFYMVECCGWIKAGEGNVLGKGFFSWKYQTEKKSHPFFQVSLQNHSLKTHFHVQWGQQIISFGPYYSHTTPTETRFFFIFVSELIWFIDCWLLIPVLFFFF